MDCVILDDGYVYKLSELEFDVFIRVIGDCIWVYIEIDDDIVSNKGGVIGVINYVIGVFNELIILYVNESIEMGILEIFVWDIFVFYFGSSFSVMLSFF